MCHVVMFTFLYLKKIVQIRCMRSVVRIATQAQGCMHGADLPALDVTPAEPLHSAQAPHSPHA